ncbi:diguanylate cyclase [Thiomicrorhabdus xiamenensis]|uniref:Diguanylate cyclase n=1 Tax=Thiomicrorhabdus xiamenensis TaxID=2739063 RepID=A0A7D4NM22_9GAMM|nr:diguanylate cyclase [Thiomicrorhabdus xiamenensis]QKI89794.1 diguanylate cyclase [Thiomicrorhabdus xiamenensis]
MKVLKSRQIKILILILLGFGISISLAYNTLDRVYFSDYIENAALKNATNKSVERERFLLGFLHQSKHKLQSISGFPAFQNFLQNPLQQDSVEALFGNFTRNCHDIMQIRFIDRDGMEVVRVHRSHYESPVEVVATENLQDKSSRYFFQQSKNKPLNEVWFSDIDLQTENGAVVKPFIPTLRAILPVAVDGEFGGILVINFFMEKTLNSLMNAPLYDSILLNEKGEILLHYDPSKSWGSYQDKPYLLADEYPALYQAILQSQSYDGGNFYFKKLNTPINTELGILFKLKASFAQSQRDQLAERETAVFFVVLFFSIVMTYVVVKLFGSTLLRLDTIDKLNSSLNEASKVAKIGFWEFENGAQYLKWSEGVFDIFKVHDYSRKITFEDFLSYIPESDRARLQVAFSESMAEKKAYFVTHQIVTADGETKYVEERAHHIYDDNGEYVRSLGSIYDITEKHLIQARYESERKKLLELMNNASDAIFILNTDGKVVEANKRVQMFLGYSLEEALQLSVWDWDMEMSEDNFGDVVSLLSHDKPLNLERIHTRKDGTTYEAEVSATLIRVGEQDLIYASVRDVTEKNQQQRLLVDRTHELQAIFDTAREGIAVVDQDMRYLKANQKYCDLLGYSQEELLKISCYDLTHPDYLEENKKIMQEVFYKGFYEDFERVCIGKDGKEKILSSSLSLIPDTNQVIVISVDHTEMRYYEQQLLRLTNTDELTQLRNRKYFNERMKEQLDLFNRYQQPFCMIIFDIDDFKAINDKYGHKVGDDVLIRMSEVITSVVRKTDLLFRVGGEEFVVLAPQTVLSEGEVLAEKIRLAVYENVDVLQGRHVSISLGVAEIRKDESFDAIYQRVDELLYQAKNSGKNRVCS